MGDSEAKVCDVMRMSLGLQTLLLSSITQSYEEMPMELLCDTHYQQKVGNTMTYMR